VIYYQLSRGLPGREERVRTSVRDLMITKYVRVRANDKISHVMFKLARDRETTVACVVDDNEKLKGIITPKRLLKSVQMAVFGRSRNPSFEWGEALTSLTASRAEDIMGPPLSVTPDYSIEDAIDLMLDKSIYELPVVDKSGKMLGGINFFQIIENWAKDLRKPHPKTMETEYNHWRRTLIRSHPMHKR
jgi:CBS-domain-containing membrane protein